MGLTMKAFISVIVLLFTFCASANSSQDLLENIRNQLDGVSSSIDNYHCARLKGYQEGLNLKKGSVTATGLTEQECRMSLVALKQMLDYVQSKYPEVSIKKVISKVVVTHTRNSLGSCMVYDDSLANPSYKDREGALVFSIRDFVGEKFEKYSLPIIQDCSKKIMAKVEASLKQ